MAMQRTVAAGEGGNTFPLQQVTDHLRRSLVADRCCSCSQLLDDSWASRRPPTTRHDPSPSYQT
ncbi:hypothetical protein Hamer_G024177 [Homarus americanus]|uniref:Uncharacterized protein n=1 Tax=Homarus americanus TaxID=6706 RepID=A0A8J5JZJ7_HOMAM|nr:hypothetical protein Hamer_G024177 [Homarus americanus]